MKQRDSRQEQTRNHPQACKAKRLNANMFANAPEAQGMHSQAKTHPNKTKYQGYLAYVLPSPPNTSLLCMSWGGGGTHI